MTVVSQTAVAPLLTTDSAQRFERVLATLLSPIDHAPGGSDWATATCDAVRDFVGASAVTFQADALGENDFAPHLPPAVWQAFVQHYYHVDRPSQELANGTHGVAHVWMFTDRVRFQRSALRNGWSQPNGLHDLMVVQAWCGEADGPPLAGRLWIAFPREHDEAELAHKMALLAAVRPAFRAGVAAWRRVGRFQSELGRIVDALDHAVAVCDPSGRVLHANTRLSALLAADADARRLQREMETAARGLRTGGPAVGSVQTTRGRYRLTSKLADAGVMGVQHAVLVTVERLVNAALSDDDLRGRFSLTRQEVAVARLIAEGLSNVEVGQRLELSWYTARNHAERLMRKLGVSSRARVGAVLRGDVSPAAVEGAAA